MSGIMDKLCFTFAVPLIAGVIVVFIISLLNDDDVYDNYRKKISWKICVINNLICVIGLVISIVLSYWVKG